MRIHNADTGQCVSTVHRYLVLGCQTIWVYLRGGNIKGGREECGQDRKECQANDNGRRGEYWVDWVGYGRVRTS
jgi:hypothetical protein